MVFKYTSQVFPNDKLELMKKKGVYPYDYMDCWQKFSDTKLPEKDEFYSLLTDENISDEQYKHAQKVWNNFNMKAMGDYHDVYLKSDILLLADVFENFRKTCHQYYELDPCHYFTSPGLSWDAMLKMTGIKLDLMTDIDMFQFIEKGLRGGISYIANRYGKANNKYMSSYKPDEPNKYIMYLDANNLYGWAMSQYLPTGGFRWLTDKQIQKLNINVCRFKIKKVHRILEFDQSPWLAKYINFNTEKRMNAKNAFEKDFFKLLNNSVFGKTMENIRKRVDVRLVTDKKKLSKLASKPTFVNSKIFSEDLVAVHKRKEILKLDRPAYVGMCILDLSKTLMYEFHYNYIKRRYENKAKLLFTDTASLCYEIQTKDIYNELWEDKELFDKSDYPFQENKY